MILPPPRFTLFPYTTLFRSSLFSSLSTFSSEKFGARAFFAAGAESPRSEEHCLNSSHVRISYAVFCLKKKKNNHPTDGCTSLGGPVVQTSVIMYLVHWGQVL